MRGARENGPVRAVVFDFDGTLTPLTLDFSNMRNEVETLARHFAEEHVITALSHLYVIEFIYELEATLGESGQGFRRMAFDKIAELETAETACGKELYPYTREVLRDLKSKDLKIAIVTRNCLAALKHTFPDVDTFVDVVMTRDDVRRVKPDPEHVAAALLALDVAPGDAMVVGDHPTDVAAGLSIGTRTVAVLSGRSRPEDFEKAGAQYIVDDIRDVKRFI